MDNSQNHPKPLPGACAPGCRSASLVARARRIRDGGRLAELREQARARQGQRPIVPRANGADKHAGEVNAILAREDFAGQISRAHAERLMAIVQGELRQGPLFEDLVSDDFAHRRFAGLLADLLGSLSAGCVTIDAAHNEARRLQEQFLMPEERHRREAARMAKAQKRDTALPPEYALAGLIRDLSAAPGLPADHPREIRDLIHANVVGAVRRIRRALDASGAPPSVRLRAFAELRAALSTSPDAAGNSGSPDFPSEPSGRLSARLGTLPLSVIDIRPQDDRALYDLVGDTGELRAASTRHFPDSKNSASVFSPAVAEFLVSTFTKLGDLILDPFAGGGTRAVITAGLGRRYLGVEIRADEAERANAQLRDLGFASLAQIVLAPGGAASFDWLGHVEPKSAALVLTCPPYWNLERYSDDPADLSNLPTYDGFLAALARVIDALRPALRPGAYAAWVLGRILHPETGELLDLPGDAERLHKAAGFIAWDEIVLSRKNGSPAAKRVAQFERTRRVIRVHDKAVIAKLPESSAAPAEGPGASDQTLGS